MLTFILEIVLVVLLIDVLKEVFPTLRSLVHGIAERLRDKLETVNHK